MDKENSVNNSRPDNIISKFKAIAIQKSIFPNLSGRFFQRGGRCFRFSCIFTALTISYLQKIFSANFILNPILFNESNH
jgi:hypothetical protein